MGCWFRVPYGTYSRATSTKQPHACSAWTASPDHDCFARFSSSQTLTSFGLSCPRSVSGDHSWAKHVDWSVNRAATLRPGPTGRRPSCAGRETLAASAPGEEQPIGLLLVDEVVPNGDGLDAHLVEGLAQTLWRTPSAPRTTKHRGRFRLPDAVELAEARSL